MWHLKSTNPKLEDGYAFKKDMKDEVVEEFNPQSFTEGSDISQVTKDNSKNSIVEHLSAKEKTKTIENNFMRNGYIVEVSPSLDNW